MLGYAAKRIARGLPLFLALFLSVSLAATLFSGILQGADSVGAAMLNRALGATDVDIVSSAENRNLTRTALGEVEEAIGGIEHVTRVEHLIRGLELGAGLGIDVNVSGVNASMPFTIVAITSNSSLVKGIAGVERLEGGMIYVEAGSVNASLFHTGDAATMKVPTYIPGGTLIDIQNRYASFTVCGVVEIDDRLFSIAMGRYSLFLRSILTGTTETGRRPPHQLIIVSEETMLEWLKQIYAEGRRHTRALIAETVIGLDRGKLLNPWDIAGSAREVKLVFERVNGVGARYGYVPVNYLGALLEAVDAVSSRMKTNTLMVAAPVFFTAWYLGVTISDISMGLRRREIGLLLTRGLTHGQVLYTFLFEALLVSLLAGAVGILMGAVIIPLIMPGMGGLQVFRSISPVTVSASLAFSCALAILAVYRPARRAADMEVVDALREYRAEEEAVGSWQEPMLALALGAYKLAMLLLGISVESLRPATGNVVVFLLYSTWWGVDYILTYIAPILFFWGFTKLFIQHSTRFHDLIGRAAGVLVGDVAIFSTLSARRNVRRTAASTFMMALIIGYGVSVIGSVASTDDFMDRAVRMTIGADASVWLFSGEGAEDLAGEIAAMEGAASATVETWFEAESSLGTIPVRAIDPLRWEETAYMEPGWLKGGDAFEGMDGSETAVLMEKGAAERLGVELNGTMLLKLGTKVHSLTVVGLFGREPGESWTLQNPTLYVPEGFLSEVRERYITQTRILVRLEEDADAAGFAKAVEGLDPNVDVVDVTEVHLREAASNVFLVGPRRVEELGVYFAALVSSVGVALIVSTALRSRWKELIIMAIRGLSKGQIAATLLVENVGMALFATVLGSTVGFISLRGELEVFNAAVSAALERRIVFPPSAQLSLAVVLVLLIVSTVAPILMATRRVSGHPTWRIEE